MSSQKKFYFKHVFGAFTFFLGSWKSGLHKFLMWLRFCWITANTRPLMYLLCRSILKICATIGKTRCKTWLILWTLQQTLLNSLKLVVCSKDSFSTVVCQSRLFLSSVITRVPAPCVLSDEVCMNFNVKMKATNWQNGGVARRQEDTGVRIGLILTDNYWELTTVEAVIFRLTGALFRRTIVLFRHFAISCYKHASQFYHSLRNAI